MRWIHIRKAATLDPELRKTFEQYGVISMQVMLATTNYFRHGGRDVMVGDVLSPLLSWLTEQYDKAERRETWSLTMEVAITVLVAAELVLLLFKG